MILDSTFEKYAHTVTAVPLYHEQKKRMNFQFGVKSLCSGFLIFFVWEKREDLLFFVLLFFVSIDSAIFHIVFCDGRYSTERIAVLVGQMLVLMLLLELD